MANFKYGGKRKSGASQPTDSCTQPSANEDGDVECTRRSTRQRVAPVEWWRASANMVEATDLCEPKTYKEAVTGPDQLHWKATIAAELRSMDDREIFIQSKLPPGQRAIDTKWVFIKCIDGQCVFLLVYVDDVLVTGSSAELIASVKTQLKERFEMTDSGSGEFVLGIERSPTSMVR